MMAVEPVLSTVSETCGSTAHCKVGKVSATDDTRCATGEFQASVAVSFNVDAGRNGQRLRSPVLVESSRLALGVGLALDLANCQLPIAQLLFYTSPFI